MSWNGRVAGLVVGLTGLLVTEAVAAETGREFGLLTATAAVVVDNQTGEVLFARNPTQQLPPASTTKLLTAMIALRRGDLDATLPVSRYAATMPPSKAYLRPGWTLSAHDLLYAMLLRSANDASVVIAEGIAGSVPSFARVMNATARSIGAMQSNFINPNGLPAPGHYSTAHDLALIMRHALQTPGMRQILSTQAAVIQPQAGTRRHIALRSTNRLLWRGDLNVIGKTGYTREAKRCFVGSASGNGREIIIAVLGSRSLWSDVEFLVQQGLGDASPDESWQERARWQQASAVPVPDTSAQWRGGAAAVPGPARRATPRAAQRSLAAAKPARGAFASSERTVTRAGNAGGGPQRRAGRQAIAQGDRPDPREITLRYHLHLASYRSRTRADQLRRDVARHGYQAAVEPLHGRPTTYRVTVRGLRTRDAARNAANTLRRSFRVEPVIVAVGT